MVKQLLWVPLDLQHFLQLLITISDDSNFNPFLVQGTKRMKQLLLLSSLISFRLFFSNHLRGFCDELYKMCAAAFLKMLLIKAHDRMWTGTVRLFVTGGFLL